MFGSRLYQILLLFIVTGVCAAFAGCTIWKEKPVSSWSAATGGEHLERLFWQEVKAGNWTELEKHLAPSFVLVSPSGSRDRAAALEHLKTLQLADYALGEFNVQTNGSDLVVSYAITMHGTHGGQPLPPRPVRMMTVWQQEKNGWMAIAHSAVPQTGE